MSATRSHAVGPGAARHGFVAANGCYESRETARRERAAGRSWAALGCVRLPSAQSKFLEEPEGTGIMMTDRVVEAGGRLHLRLSVCLGALLAVFGCAVAEAQIDATAPVPLNADAATDAHGDHEPRLVTDRVGNWVTVWESGAAGGDRDIFVSRSSDNGATWTAPAALNTNAATDSENDWLPQVATDGWLGHWVAVWQSAENLGGAIGSDDDILVSRSTDSGATWTAPMALNTNAATDAGADYQPQVVTDGWGNWVAVWWSGDSLGGTIGSDFDILVSRSTDNGTTWTAPAALNTNAATDVSGDQSPHVATDIWGNWVAVWQSTNSLGGTIGGDWDILMARSTDNGATWTPPVALNTNAAADFGDDLAPLIRTDQALGGSGWIVVWHSNDSLGGAIGGDWDILVSRSTDSGFTWIAPAALNTNANTDIGNDFDVHLQLSSYFTGHWIAAWSSGHSLGGTIGSDYDILVSRSTDNGATWSAATALNLNAGTDSGADGRPALATDGWSNPSNWVAVWGSFDSLGGTIGTDEDILFTRWTFEDSDGDGLIDWDEINLYGTDPDDSDTDNDGLSDGDEVRMYATDPNDVDSDNDGQNDNLEVLDGSDPNSASSISGIARTFPAALNSNAATDSGADFFPRVATDRNGIWFAIWNSDESFGGFFGSDDDILGSGSINDGASWYPPQVMNQNAATDSGDDRSPALVSDGLGNWVGVWESFDTLGGTIGSDRDILVAQSDTFTVSPPAPLNSNAPTDSGTDRWPVVTTDGAGNWVAVWYSNDSLGATIGTDNDIFVSRSTNNGASWTAVAALNTNAANDSGSDTFPQITTDGVGNWAAVWASTDSLGATIGTDSDILVSRSTNNGTSWTAPGALNTNAPTDSGSDASPHLATDGAGVWLAVWDSAESLGGTIGTDRDILVSRSTNNGTTWTAPAALNTNAFSDSGNDADPQIATDGAGNWVAVWISTDDLGGTIGGDPDILYALSTDSGVTWTAPAALNTNAATDGTGEDGDELPQITTDGAGHWVVVWATDEPLGGAIGSDWDILYTRFTFPLDTDGDGLTDEEEIEIYGTNPNDSDSDNDGLSDGAEADVHGTNPLDLDTDGDGFDDGEEVTAGTNPLSDTDYPTTLIWADFAYTGAPETGAVSLPYNTLAEAIARVTVAGTVRIKGNTGDSTTNETPRITKAMRIAASGGAVRIGVGSGFMSVEIEEAPTEEAAKSIWFEGFVDALVQHLRKGPQ